MSAHLSSIFTKNFLYAPSVDFSTAVEMTKGQYCDNRLFVTSSEVERSSVANFMIDSPSARFLHFGRNDKKSIRYNRHFAPKDVYGLVIYFGRPATLSPRAKAEGSSASESIILYAFVHSSAALGMTKGQYAIIVTLSPKDAYGLVVYFGRPATLSPRAKVEGSSASELF